MIDSKLVFAATYAVNVLKRLPGIPQPAVLQAISNLEYALARKHKDQTDQIVILHNEDFDPITAVSLSVGERLLCRLPDGLRIPIQTAIFSTQLTEPPMNSIQEVRIWSEKFEDGRGTSVEVFFVSDERLAKGIESCLLPGQLNR
jgi:hypothetical protein